MILYSPTNNQQLDVHATRIEYMKDKGWTESPKQKEKPKQKLNRESK